MGPKSSLSIHHLPLPNSPKHVDKPEIPPEDTGSEAPEEAKRDALKSDPRTRKVSASPPAQFIEARTQRKKQHWDLIRNVGLSTSRLLVLIVYNLLGFKKGGGGGYQHISRLKYEAALLLEFPVFP